MRAFAAVVAAGGKTGSTPQLVSKYVAALEDDLGARLLNRTTRRVALTEAGRACHPAASRCWSNSTICAPTRAWSARARAVC